MARRRFGSVTATLTLVLAYLFLQSVFAINEARANTGGPETRPPSFAAIARRTTPVVVNISTTSQRPSRGSSSDPIEEFYGRSLGDASPRENRRSLGSGILISRDGEILTSYHVVRNADIIKVKLADQSEYEARLLGKDERTDLALIKIRKPSGNLPFARLGSSSQLDVGDWVMAIGNPFGLEHTVTAGIVSAKGRVIGAGPYDNFIQTDASINPGNSGGPLINGLGEVVGVNTAMFSQTGGNIGIGFAIPIDLAKKIVDQLRKNGRVVRGWLGIRAQDLSPQLALFMGVSRSGEMAMVTEVAENSPAAEAGVKIGDVIVELNGRPVPKSQDLPGIIADTAPGQKLMLKLVRDKKEQITAIKIGELPYEPEATTQAVDSRDVEMGLKVQRITPEAARRLGLSSTKGVLVMEVQAGSPADQVGLEPADVIREINQRPVNNVKDFERAVRQVRRGDRILLLVQRGDSAVFFAVKRKS